MRRIDSSLEEISENRMIKFHATEKLKKFVCDWLKLLHLTVIDSYYIFSFKFLFAIVLFSDSSFWFVYFIVVIFLIHLNVVNRQIKIRTLICTCLNLQQPEEWSSRYHVGTEMHRVCAKCMLKFCIYMLKYVHLLLT